MTVTYQRPAAPGDWGRVVVGERALPVRLAVLIAGLIAWLGVMLLATGTDGLAALWTNLYFLGAIVLLTAATQTIGLRAAGFFFLVGGVAMWLMLPLGGILGAIEPLRGQTNTVFLFPLLEEALKIVPAVAAIWWWSRSGRSWSLSASDIVLITAATGAGFAIVEDAFIRSHSGWPDQLAWLPVTEIIGGRMIAGHAIWATAAGATIGIALLLRSRDRRLAYAIAVSGFVVVSLDHIRNNYGNRFNDLLAGLLDGIGAQGWLVIGLLVVLVVAVIAADAWVIQRSPPRPPRHIAPPIGQGLVEWRRAWSFRLAQRALAVANHHLHRVGDADLPKVGWAAVRLDLLLRAAEPEEGGD